MIADVNERLTYYHKERIEKTVRHHNRDTHKAVGIINETVNSKTFIYPFKSEIKVNR